MLCLVYTKVLNPCICLQLSHYLDLVEVQISKQISLQSEAFFQAVCSQDKITENIGCTRTAVKNLRYE